MNGLATVKHLRGTVNVRDIAKNLHTDGLPLSSRGKGKILLRSALPVPVSGDVTVSIPRFTSDWGSVGAAVFAMCSSKKSAMMRIEYDPSGGHYGLDPWVVAMRWLAEYCEDLSSRLWSWRPISLPWERQALDDAQSRLSSCMQHWSKHAPALFRLAEQVSSSGNHQQLRALSQADAVQKSAPKSSPEEELAVCRLAEMNLLVNHSSPLALKRFPGRILNDRDIDSVADEMLNTRHDDIRSAALSASELLKILNGKR